MPLQSLFLPRAFGAGRLSVLARLAFVVSLTKLLLDFLRNDINRGVKITLDVFGKQVRTREGNAHGTGKLPLWGFGLVTVESYPCIDGVAVEVFQLADAAYDMIFDGIGQGHIVRQQDQVHGPIMQSARDKIQ